MFRFGRRRHTQITLSVDEDTIKKVRKIAVERDTTLTATRPTASGPLRV